MKFRCLIRVQRAILILTEVCLNSRQWPPWHSIARTSLHTLAWLNMLTLAWGTLVLEQTWVMEMDSTTQNKILSLVEIVLKAKMMKSTSVSTLKLIGVGKKGKGQKFLTCQTKVFTCSRKKVNLAGTHQSIWITTRLIMRINGVKLTQQTTPSMRQHRVLQFKRKRNRPFNSKRCLPVLPLSFGLRKVDQRVTRYLFSHFWLKKITWVLFSQEMIKVSFNVNFVKSQATVVTNRFPNNFRQTLIYLNGTTLLCNKKTKKRLHCLLTLSRLLNSRLDNNNNSRQSLLIANLQSYKA